ncbi:MAG: NAD-dependent epimerase/dehydratase family protein [Syntrophothermus sp.]
MKIKAIVTGATGMVGEGVVHECLNHPDVESVLIAGRRPSGIMHPKVKEVIIPDFFDLSSAANELAGYNACFFCLGVSSVGMKESEYFRATYTLTMNFAQTVSRLNPGMTFCYVSGLGTDSSETGKSMWARVKGKTENELMKLPFRGFYAFRPGFMLSTPGMKNTLRAYKYVAWLYPLGKLLFPSYVSTLAQVGQAMINSVKYGFNKKILEVKDIIALSEKNN